MPNAASNKMSTRILAIIIIACILGTATLVASLLLWKFRREKQYLLLDLQESRWLFCRNANYFLLVVENLDFGYMFFKLLLKYLLVPKTMIC